MNEDIIFYAFRYALGRRTYSVGIVVDYILENWDLLSERIREIMKIEIREAIKNGEAGMDMDENQWKRILELPPPHK